MSATSDEPLPPPLPGGPPRPSGPPATSEAPPVEPAGSPPTTGSPASAPRQPSWPLWVVGIVLALGVGGVAFFSLGGSDDDRVETAAVIPPTTGPTTAGSITTLPSPSAAVSTTSVSTTPATDTATVPTTLATTTCTTIVTTSTITTTTLPPPNANITAEGTAVASSRRCGSWDVRFAIDGDPSTSWASSATGLDGATVRWTGVRDDRIGSIGLVSNSLHYDQTFRTDHGFEAVRVELFDAAGVRVWDSLVDLSGTPDPDVIVTPYVIGRSILLTFLGPENSSTGGFAELTVLAIR